MKKLFNQLMPYLNRKYYNGRGIRWMIEDANGRSVYCFCCGNIANAVGEVKLMGWLFRLPVCKAHLRSYMNNRTNGDWSIASPGVFPMNLKHKNVSYNDWCTTQMKRVASLAGLPVEKIDFAHSEVNYESYLKSGNVDVESSKK